MNYMSYKTIQVMKKSERAEVIFAAVDGVEKPVVIKKLTEANPEIYRDVAKIDSPHIPKIYCVEEQEGVLFVAEEFIDGGTLSSYLEKETLTDTKKLELMLQLCDALEVLHRCIPPVIHRDIKPSNILVTPEGVLKIIDFDAARQYKTEKNTSDTRLLGTIEYAAPEQFGYSQTDLRSDIYSVGVVFSEIKISKDATFAKDWKRLVDKCTSFDPENRYKNAAELKKDLLKCIRKEKSEKKYAGLAVAVVTVLLFSAGSLFFNRNKETEVVNRIPTPTVAVELLPAPSTTELPEITQTPTPVPEVALKNIQAPLMKNKSKRTIGTRTEATGYLISNMNYVESEHVSHKIKDNGSALLQFEENCGRIVFELPVIVDMDYCVDVMTRIDTQAGEVTFLLYDENGIVVESFYINKTQEAEEVCFSTTCKGNVAYIGFMASDDTPADYSGFTATVYYVDFMVINPDTPKISYTMEELTEEEHYYCDYTRNEDGSVTIEYEQFQGKLKLRLPEEIDMRYCVGIGIVMESEQKLLEVNSYNKKFRHVESFRGYKTNGVEEKLLRVYSKTAISGLGLMIDGPETEDYSGCTATVHAINFYMEDGYQEKMAQAAVASLELTGNKNIVGKQTEPAMYLISGLDYVDSNDLSYQLNEDGSVFLKFTEIYDSIQYELPEMIDMSCCEKFAVKMDVHKGEVAVVLHDETGTSVESFYHPYGTSEEDGMSFSWSPRHTGKAAYISFMANDGEREDYSDFDSTVYSVTFYMEEPEENEVVPTPEVTEPVGTEGIVLLQDRIVWNESALPVTVALNRAELCKVERVFLCEQESAAEPYAEAIAELPQELYTISGDGTGLSLGYMFFAAYDYPEELCLYVEFSDGRGERLWLAKEGTPLAEYYGTELSYTERFTYEALEEGMVKITGLTEGAKADKRNRQLVIPKKLDNMPVVAIAEGAFAGVPITFVSLPEGLLEIGKGAFYGCNLGSVTIPDSVTYIGPRAFGANHGMTEIQVEENNPNYSSRIGVLYDKYKTVLYQMPANFTGPKFTVIKSVREISEYAFGNCRNVTRIYGDASALTFGEQVYWNTPAVMKQKVLTGNVSGIEYYTFDALDVVDSYYLSHRLNDNNTISIQFEKMYGELILALHEEVDMKYCTGIKLKMKSEAGNIVIKLYDEDFNEVQTFRPRKAKGEQLLAYIPTYSGRVSYIGFMANDRDLADYSTFETILYYLRFEFICTENTTPVTYTMAELLCTRHYNVEYDSREGGSMHFRFSKRYGAYFQKFPEPVDMSKCAGVKIKLKNEDASINFSLLDENGEEIEAFYDYITTGIQNAGLVHSEKQMVYGIKHMTDDHAPSVYDGDNETIIYSITFYMWNE